MRNLALTTTRGVRALFCLFEAGGIKKALDNGEIYDIRTSLVCSMYEDMPKYIYRMPDNCCVPLVKGGVQIPVREL
jgi:hypothetical protein